jgi:pilus assembly protein Flp/PilA
VQGVAMEQVRCIRLVLCRGLCHSGDSHKTEDTMKNFAKKLQRFLVSEDGPTAVEYAVMLALIVIVCLTAISSIGTNANTTFQNVADSISGAGGAAGAS